MFLESKIGISMLFYFQIPVCYSNAKISIRICTVKKLSNSKVRIGIGKNRESVHFFPIFDICCELLENFTKPSVKHKCKAIFSALVANLWLSGPTFLNLAFE